MLDERRDHARHPPRGAPGAVLPRRPAARRAGERARHRQRLRGGQAPRRPDRGGRLRVLDRGLRRARGGRRRRRDERPSGDALRRLQARQRGHRPRLLRRPRRRAASACGRTRCSAPGATRDSPPRRRRRCSRRPPARPYRIPFGGRSQYQYAPDAARAFVAAARGRRERVRACTTWPGRASTWPRSSRRSPPPPRTRRAGSPTTTCSCRSPARSTRRRSRRWSAGSTRRRSPSAVADAVARFRDLIARGLINPVQRGAPWSARRVRRILPTDADPVLDDAPAGRRHQGHLRARPLARRDARRHRRPPLGPDAARADAAALRRRRARARRRRGLPAARPRAHRRARAPRRRPSGSAR